MFLTVWSIFLTLLCYPTLKQCSLCGTARGDGGGSSSDKGGGVVDLTEEDDGLKSEKLVV